jgi:hypothetical protein
MSWSDIVAILALIVGVLALIRDVFDYQLTWSWLAIKQYLVSRRPLLIALAFLVISCIVILVSNVGMRAEISQMKATMQALTLTPSPTQQIIRTEVTREIVVTPTADPNILSLSNTPGTVRVFNGIRDPAYQQGTGSLTIIRNAPDIAYEFNYDMPTEGKGYARLVFFFDPPKNFTEYNFIEISISFSDPDSKLDVNLRDAEDGANYIRVGDREFLGGVGVVANSTSEGQLIKVPLRKNYKDVNQENVVEIGFNANADFARGRHSFTIHKINLTK